MHASIDHARILIDLCAASKVRGVSIAADERGSIQGVVFLNYRRQTRAHRARAGSDPIQRAAVAFEQDDVLGLVLEAAPGAYPARALEQQFALQDVYFLAAVEQHETAIDALVERKLVKRGPKDKTSGKHRFSITKTGEKNLTSGSPPATT